MSVAPSPNESAVASAGTATVTTSEDPSNKHVLIWIFDDGVDIEKLGRSVRAANEPGSPIPLASVIEPAAETSSFNRHHPANELCAVYCATGGGPPTYIDAVRL